MTIEIAIFAAVIIGVIAGLFLENIRRRIDPVADGPRVAPAPLRLMGPGAFAADPAVRRNVDSATALRLVSDAGFASRPLLSGREADVLAVVEAIAGEAGLGWRVVPQVRLADIIASSDDVANAVIDDHRLDMLIVSAARMPVAAVDYQPLGQVHDDSALNAAVKREALRRADIPFLEIRANEPLDTLRAQILRLATPAPAAKASRIRAPVPKAAPKAATKSVTRPAPAPRPAARAAAKAAAPLPPPIARPAMTPVARTAKPAAKPAATPVAPPPPAARAATKPAARPSAKPTAKPAVKTAAKDPPAEP